MSEGEFWERVAENLGARPAEEEPEVVEAELVELEREPCGVCGSVGACGYDSEGRALIHAEGAEE
jgi:hypothetical protein